MGAKGKTGGWGGRWVQLERPKPARVEHVEAFWRDRPPVLSPRCTYWVRQILRGWRPPRRVAMEGYYAATEWYGAYLWEYLHVVFPLVEALERSRFAAAAGGGRVWPAETGLGWVRVDAGEHRNLSCRWTCVGEWEYRRVVDDVAFAEKPGGPATSWWPVPGAPLTFNGGDELEVSVPVETVLARSGSRLTFDVTLAEASGETVPPA